MIPAATSPAPPRDRDARIRRLHRARPVRWGLRLSLSALGLLGLWAWTSGDLSFAAFRGARAATNVARFWREITPYPLQGRGFDLGIYLEWWRAELAPVVVPALLATLALSVAAIGLAAAGGLLASFFAARNVTTARPFGELPPGRTAPEAPFRLLRGGVRALLLLLRGIPEYVWAFLLLTLLGVGPWPAVIALALHNLGILGRLYAEIIEDLNPHAARTLRSIGAGRGPVALGAVAPAALNRWLLFFFYRWETCVREATVLGLLGFVSLGWYIQDARAGVRYDEMVHLIALGTLLIVGGDFVSDRVRRAIRES